jgi:PIN domain nuclease of toxin-antitoxin system
VRLLLDTHAFLWFVAGSAELSTRARRRIEDVGNERLLSIASVWELAIKASLGKIMLAVPLGELVQEGALDNEISLLPVSREHAVGVGVLPFHHRDPFDRMLAVQAAQEGLTIVSRDDCFDASGVRRIW